MVLVSNPLAAASSPLPGGSIRIPHLKKLSCLQVVYNTIQEVANQESSSRLGLFRYHHPLSIENVLGGGIIATADAAATTTS